MPETDTSPTPTTRRFPTMVVSTVVLVVALIVLVATGNPGEDLVAELGSQIRCPVCQGVPIADSPAQMATDMMEILRDEVAAGANRQEAIDAVIGAYPGSLLLDPPLSASSVALWLIPALALIGGVGLAATVRRGRTATVSSQERSELNHRLVQVRSDLDDLAGQEAAGDIDHEAAAHLREAYSAELAETEHALTNLTTAPPEERRSTRRGLVGGLILVGAFVVVMVVAGAFVVDRPESGSGVASSLQGDPSDYSNETLAAVIAANQDNPLIDGMRMALAERYFTEGDYPSAFPYYLEVASSDRATPEQAATALTRLGWMAFDGNNEADTALDLLAQAREVLPEDPFPLYLESLVRWCGKGDNAGAAAGLETVLATDGLDDGIRSQIESEYEMITAGEQCPRTPAS